MKGFRSLITIGCSALSSTKRKNYTSNQKPKTGAFIYLCRPKNTVAVAQLVRASDCGSEGRGFETHQPPCKSRCDYESGFCFSN